MTTSTAQALLAQLCAQIQPSGRSKVAVIGAGSIGSAVMYSLVTQKIANELVLIDKDINLAKNEMLDIQNGVGFQGIPYLEYSSDIAKCKDARVVVITAGQPMPVTRNFDMNMIRYNVQIFLDIIPAIIAVNPRPILVVVTKPVDIMTHVAWKISGLPTGRVIGTGCTLLTKRFQQLVAMKLGISPLAVQAVVLGENTTDCLPLWSSVTVCGVRLKDINKRLGMDSDPEHWADIFKKMLESNLNISKLKALNIYGVAGCVANIVSSIIKNSFECFTVSTHLQGCEHGTDKSKDVFISMPAILGANGTQFIIRQVLSQAEKDRLQETANKYKFIQGSLQY